MFFWNLSSGPKSVADVLPLLVPTEYQHGNFLHTSDFRYREAMLTEHIPQNLPVPADVDRDLVGMGCDGRVDVLPSCGGVVLETFLVGPKTVFLYAFIQILDAITLFIKSFFVGIEI